jgi:hypothetical protein
MTTATRRPSPWLPAAAAISIAGGGIALLAILDAVVGAALPPVHLLGIGLGLSILSIATGVGLLRGLGWARIAAAALAGLELFLAGSTLIGLASGGEPSWLGLVTGLAEVVACLIVLFAVTRRWSV